MAREFVRSRKTEARAKKGTFYFSGKNLKSRTSPFPPYKFLIEGIDAAAARRQNVATLFFVNGVALPG
jgi:hypothetical protein